MLRNLPYRYNPSPSTIIREKGEVVEGSYFVAEGKLHLQGDNTIRCDFEVAFMKSGIAWAVVYIEFPYYIVVRKSHTDHKFVYKPKVLHKSKLRKTSARQHLALSGLVDNIKRAEKITGDDILRGEKVEVRLDRWVNIHGGETSYGIRLVFIVEEYTVFDGRINVPQTHYHFELVNLPVNRSLSSKETYDQKWYELREEMNKVKLEIALQRALELSNVETEQEDLIKLAKHAAEEAAEELRKNSGPIYLEFLPIEVEGELIARLYWLHDFSNKSYNQQPTARLFIDSEKLPANWTAFVTAEWICALVSLCVGRAIAFNHYYLAPSDRKLLPPKRYWRSFNIEFNTFVAFTEKNNRLPTHIGLRENAEVLKFVGEILQRLFTSPQENASEYLFSIDTYCYYASASLDVQQKCTLLCAIVEDIFSVWKKSLSSEIPPENQKQNRKKIINTVVAEIRKLGEQALPKDVSENASTYNARFEKFIERMRSTIGANLSQSFTHRLKYLFSSHGWNTQLTHSRSNMGYRVEKFVESRNKLVHEHRFANFQQDNMGDDRSLLALRQEIDNLEMIVPLLLATLLGYRGRYWDKISNSWSWMPSK